MRIAHLSDLHVLALEGVSPMRFFNKRFTGWVNLRVKRSHKHRLGHVRAVAREISRACVDHVVVTGDLTNLALREEFVAVRSLLEEDLHLRPDQISVVPGNHDLYTRGAMRTQRFTNYFGKYLQSDLPELSATIALGAFPFVKLREAVAIIGLSSAVPRPPLMASGQLGLVQLEGLRRILAHPEVQSRTPVILIHHPVHNPSSRAKTLIEGLWDADALIAEFAKIRHGLVLHGHLHVRRSTGIATEAGEMLSVGATSASLHHAHEHKMAGFNLYDFDATGVLRSLEAHVFDPTTDTFDVRVIPQHP
jgi:3',5'-cyclic AMP phosphodiesterase CpdA